jgi:polyhydroxybutyrate depolymerase
MWRVSWALLLALAGCRRSPPPRIPVWTGADAGAAPELPARSAGCGQGGSPRPPTGARSFTIRVADKPRSYTIVVPTLREEKALPVVFFFHGKRAMNRTFIPSLAVSGGLAELAGIQNGAILVVPQGQPFLEEKVLGWNQSCRGDDVLFFDAMLEQIERDHCVDPRAVFAGGFSWGADMVDTLACCRGEKLRAVAPASGDEIGVNARCPSRKIPAFRLTYADNDFFYKPPDFEASIRFFRDAQRCEAATDPIAPAPCVAYRGCRQPVITCLYPRWGHRLPEDYAAATWAFFSSMLR